MPHESNAARYGTNSILLIDHSAFADMDLPDYVRAVLCRHHLSSSFAFPPLWFFSVLLLFQNENRWSLNPNTLLFTSSSSPLPLSPPPLVHPLYTLFTTSHLWLPTTFYSCAVTRELLRCTWKQTAGTPGWLPFKFAGSAKSSPS